MKNCLFILSMIFLLTACESVRKETTTVHSSIFACCNLWEDVSMDSNSIEENVALYLEEQAIGYTDISIVEVGDPWVCFSCCGCYEGRDIEVLIDEEDLQKALDAGFSE